MALKDNWIPQDNTMDADAKIINMIANAVIEMEEQVEETPEINIVIDSEMLDTSTNPVQNKVVKEYVDNATNDKVSFDIFNEYTENVDKNFVKSSELKTEIEKIFPNGDEVGY